MLAYIVWASVGVEVEKSNWSQALECFASAEMKSIMVDVDNAGLAKMQREFLELFLTAFTHAMDCKKGNQSAEGVDRFADKLADIMKRALGAVEVDA
eukprot:14589201-Alexandrium_andersonii.AAC.1